MVMNYRPPPTEEDVVNVQARRARQRGGMMFDVIPINGQSWIICGGRGFADAEMFNSAMGDLVRLKGMPRLIIEGGAAGADKMAGEWAKRHALILRIEMADWETHGRAAGAIRNARMLEHNPQLVVAFPGGRGTADMVRRSRAAGVDVAEIKYEE